MDFPNSPYGVAQTLVEDFRSGRRDGDEYLRNLEVFQGFLDQWAQGVENFPEDPGFPAAVEVKYATLNSLDLYYEALGHFRSYAETRDEEAAEQGLSIARSAHELMLAATQQTQREVDRIENEMG